VKSQKSIGEKRILRILIENGKPMKVSAIAEILDCSYQLIHYHAVKKGRGQESLLDRGYVKPVDGKSAYRGRHVFLYKVTKKGRKYSREIPIGEREVLRVMIEHGEPMTVSDVARELDMNYTTARFHLVAPTPSKKSLLDRGLVEVKDQIQLRKSDGTSEYRTYIVTKKGRDCYKESSYTA